MLAPSKFSSARSRLYVSLNPFIRSANLTISVLQYVVGAFTTLLSGYLSFKTRKRGLYMVISAPFMMVGLLSLSLSLQTGTAVY